MVEHLVHLAHVLESLVQLWVLLVELSPRITYLITYHLTSVENM